MDHLHRFARSVRGVLRTHYPAFLFGLPMRETHIPIFIYHDVTPDSLRSDLEFLVRNGYRTLSLDEFMASGGRTIGRTRRVLLTFDDARASFHHVALPLLRAFDSRAALFVPTYWMSRPSADYERFMSWEQLRAAADSGLVDVQAHAHRHALVFTSGTLAGFATPDSLARYDIYDWPMRHRGGTDELGRPPLGSPFYRASPLLSASTRFLEDEEVSARCEALVRDAGGASFFSQRGWRTQLLKAHERYCARQSGRQLTEQQFDEQIAEEFDLCVGQFRRHLGYAPQYFAYPWMLGSPRSLELARRSGIETVFGVAVDYGRARTARLPLTVFGRLKSDWLKLLPGTGRASLARIAYGKLTGFSRIQHLAH